MRKVEIGLLLIAFCSAYVFAQGISATAPKVTVTAPKAAVPDPKAPAAPEIPAVAAQEVPAVAAPAAAAPAATQTATPVAQETTAPSTPADSTIADSAAVSAATDSAATDSTVADSTVAAIDSAAIAEVAPEPPPPPPPPPPVVQPAVASEPSKFKFRLNHLGGRFGLGISVLRSHAALKVPSLNNIAIQLNPAFSFSAGLAGAVEINSLLTVVPEFQYVFYRANGDMVFKSQNNFPELHQAGVSLHAFEIPILARFSFGSGLLNRLIKGRNSLYAEIGPQFGFNYYAKIYKDSENYQPEINRFAFGPSLGFGANVNEILLGFRVYFGLLEYAKDTKGYPWTIQLSATKNFFF